MNEDVHGFFIGLAIGVGLTLFAWMASNGIVEQNKISTGFLTYQNKTYTVTFFDTLDKPKKGETK